MNERRKVVVYNIVIAILLVIYIVLTTLIFINHKKIQLLKNNNPKAQKNTVKKEQKLFEDVQENKKRLAQNDYQQGNINSAVDHYREILLENPNDWEIRFKLGVMLYSKKDGRAVEHFEYILKNNPTYVHNASIRNWMKKLEDKKINIKSIKNKPSLTKYQKEVIRKLRNKLTENPNHPNKEKIQSIIDRWKKD